MNRRHVLYLAGGGAALALNVARPAMSPVLAQDGTAENGPALEGTTFEPLAFGTASVLPPAPASIRLARVRIVSGGHITIAGGPGGDGELVLIYAEAGTTTCVATVETRVLRGERLATPESAPFDVIATGAGFMLEPGDSFVGLPEAGGEFRNDGDDDVVLLMAGIGPDQVATPAA